VSRFISDRIRAVVFDAVGTLIHPDPSAADVYANAGRIFGSNLTATEIATRFRTAFRRQEEIDFVAGLRTNEAREFERWRAIVGEVLDDVNDAEACFRHLYDHFAQPTSWRIEAEAVEIVNELAARGYRVGIASNFDHRLREVLPSELSKLPLVISAEVGCRKPARDFFEVVCRSMAMESKDVLYVGDQLENDYAGALAAGLAALAFSPERTAPSQVSQIVRLGELVGK
jgi:putative hydrolase of the HAD superfamily